MALVPLMTRGETLMALMALTALMALVPLMTWRETLMALLALVPLMTMTRGG